MRLSPCLSGRGCPVESRPPRTCPVRRSASCSVRRTGRNISRRAPAAVPPGWPTADAASTGSLLKDRVGDVRMPCADEEDAGVASGLEAVARVGPQHRAVDGEGAAAIVTDEKDRAAPFAGVVVIHPCAREGDGEQVSVRVDAGPAAAARAARAGRVRAVANRLVVADDAVEHDPRDTDAAQRPAVGALAAVALRAAE